MKKWLERRVVAFLTTPVARYERYGRNNLEGSAERVARGGSWRDRPKRCTSAFRLSYPNWQKVYNVGFRVIIQAQKDASAYVKARNTD